MQTFETYIESERQRLQQLRDDATARKRQAEADLVQVDQELEAIAAYENAKRGKQPTTRAPSKRGKRKEVLDLIAQKPDGYTRAELIEALGAHDKKASMSLSNVLAALKKSGQLQHDGRIYKALPDQAAGSTVDASMV